jgi:hypothetical protein
MKRLNSAIFKYVSVVLFIVLLCGMAYRQARLKLDPQLFLLGLALLTFLFAYTKLWETAMVLFTILFGVILYTNYFYVFAHLSHDHLGIHSMIYASLLTVVTLFLYFKYYPRQRVLEKLFTWAFLVLSIIIFVIYEI